MDSETYEQIVIPNRRSRDPLHWMKESEEFEVLYIDDQPADVQLPSAIDVEVTETEPGLRGDTASGGGNKPAVVQTGARSRSRCSSNRRLVRVDTRSGEYVSGAVARGPSSAARRLGAVPERSARPASRGDVPARCARFHARARGLVRDRQPELDELISDAC